MWTRLWRAVRRGGDDGATAVEYGLIAALVVLVVIPSILFLQNALGGSDSSDGAFKTSLENEPGVTVCPAGDPNCSAINALPVANIPGLPAVVTLSATNVTATTATLNGTANANGTTTSLTFCYGVNADLSGCTVVSGTPGSVAGASAQAVTANISGLSDNTRYYYRIIGTSSKGTTRGATLNFLAGATTITFPTATTLPASNTAGVTPTLNGYVVPGGATTDVSFCYGTSNKLTGCTSVSAGQVSGTTGVAVSYAIPTALSSNRTYYFRVSATNVQGTDTGNILSFQTGSAVSPPTVVTAAASGVTGTVATLNGTVSGNGTDKADTFFCYGTTTPLASDCSNGSPVVTGSPATVNQNQSSSVTASISGLTPGQTYYFYAFATNQGNGVKGAGLTLSFTVPIIVPTVTTSTPATSISASGATLGGTVNANNGSFTTSFCYGTTSPLAADCSNGTSTAASPSPVSGGTATSISKAITGLSSGTTYYFRAGATAAGTTTYGTERSFTTSSVATVTTSTPATSISASGATLGGTVDANNGSFTTSFCYGTTSPLAADCSNGTSTPATPSPVTGNSPTNISVTLTSLGAGTTYYFRAGATSGGATVYGTERSFTTSAASPSVTTVSANGISYTAATVRGTVTSNGAATTVTFTRCNNLAMTTSCVTADALQSPVAANGSAVSVSYTWTGLTAGSTYYFRVVGDNGVGGAQAGSVLNFTTTAAAKPTATTSAATNVTTTTATFNGTVSANGAAVTSIQFQRCTNAGFNQNCVTVTATPSTLAATAGSTAVSYSATGLTTSTKYYVRVIATNSVGITTAADVNFTTN